MKNETIAYLCFLFSGCCLLIISLFICNIYYYDCFVCHGIAPSLSENLFCLGVQMFPVVAIVFIIGSLVGLVRNKLKGV